MNGVLVFILLLVVRSIATQCPSNIPSLTTMIPQSFHGATSNYEWTFSPSEAVNKPPSDSQACGNAAYITQYTQGGPCDAAANVQTAQPAIVGDTCVFSFSDGGSRSMSLTLSCNSASTIMAIDSPVMVSTPTANTYAYGFTGSYAGVCGSAPSSGGDGGGGSPACGGGCAFTIIFFVGGGLYVIGTVAWNFFKDGKRGKELAPHPEFWLMIPGLIKDGAIFSFQMVTKPCRKDGEGGSGPTYAQV